MIKIINLVHDEENFHMENFENEPNEIEMETEEDKELKEEVDSTIQKLENENTPLTDELIDEGQEVIKKAEEQTLSIVNESYDEIRFEKRFDLNLESTYIHPTQYLGLSPEQKKKHLKKNREITLKALYEIRKQM